MANLKHGTTIGGYLTYHSGNSNRSDIDWNVNILNGSIKSKIGVTTYHDHNINNFTDSVIISRLNTEDTWIYNDQSNAQYGIYHRNINSDLVISGQETLPSKSIGFIGDNNLNAYISLEDGKIFGKGGIFTNGDIIYNSKLAIGGTDDLWLRLNPNNDFSLGTYIANNLRIDGDLITSGVTISGNILPNVASTIDLGSVALPFREIHADELFLSANSLYVNGKKVIKDDSSTMVFSTDENQDLKIQTKGLGDINLVSDNTIIAQGNSGIYYTIPDTYAGKNIDFNNYSINGNISFSAIGVGGEVAFYSNTEITLTAPIVSVGSSIDWLDGSSTNANTAFNWGNHADANYLVSSDLSNIDNVAYLDKDNTFTNTGTTSFVGNIGIGTTNPDKLLTIGGDGVNGSFRVRASTDSAWFDVTHGVVSFNTNGGQTYAGGIDLGARFNITPVNDTYPTLSIRGYKGGVSDIMRVSSPLVKSGDYFNIKADGKIGIGTDIPTEKLEVDGNIKASGTLSASGYNDTNWNTAYNWGDHSTQGYLTEHQDLESYLKSDTNVAVNNLDVAEKINTTKLEVGSLPTFNYGRAVKIYDDGAQFGARITLIGTGDSAYMGVEMTTDGNLAKRTIIRHEGEGGNDYGLSFFTTHTGNIMESVRFSGDGNVGIGINRPTEKLEVDGIIKVNGGNSTEWNTAYNWGDHSTQGYLTTHQDLTGYATEDYVGTAITDLIDSSPDTLNTLDELALALGDDPNFATTVSNNIGTKLSKSNNLDDLENVITARTNLNVDIKGTINYVHPTSAGNKHIPSGGASGQFLKYSSSGTAVWANDNNTWRDLGTTSTTACAGNDSRLSNSRKASDVYAWAKASSKPSYTYSEVGAAAASHTHDDRYYTESESNSRFAYKAGTSTQEFNAYNFVSHHDNHQFSQTGSYVNVGFMASSYRDNDSGRSGLHLWHKPTGASGSYGNMNVYVYYNNDYKTVYHSGNFTPSNYLPLTGGTLTGSLVGTTAGFTGISANRLSSTNGTGLALYGAASANKPIYGIVFAQTRAASFGTHGNVTGDWATYFTMNNVTTRGWIFQRGNTNIASISSGGAATFTSTITASGGNSTEWNTAYGWGDFRSFGLGVNSGYGVTDLNNVQVAGFGKYTAGTNIPNSQYGVVLTLPYASTYNFQLAGSINGEDLYLRNKRNGTFYSWHKLYHSGNIPTWNQSTTGNAATATTATKLATARTIDITGDITATAVSFDGTANISISASVNNDSHTHDGRYYTESESEDRYFRVNKSAPSNLDLALTQGSYSFSSSSSNTPYSYGNILNIISSGSVQNNSNNWLYQLGFGTNAKMYLRNKINRHGFSSWKTLAFTTDNVASATKLATARTITISGDVNTVSNTFDGTANKTFSLVVKNDSHTHDGRYYTESESNSRFAYKAGSTSQGFSVNYLDAVNRIKITKSTGGDGGWDNCGLILENTSTTTGEAVVSYKNAGSGGTGSNYWIHGLNQSNIWKLAYGTSFTDGNMKMQVDTGGNLTASGNVTAYSDIRVKDNIETLTNALDNVNKLRGVRYTRKDQEDKTKKHIGVIAQELEKYYPELVETLDDEIKTKTVNYAQLTGVLIEAIKEQQLQINELYNKLNN